MRVSWQGEEREEIRPGMQPSQNWFFSLLSCKLLFLPTCLWNVLFFKVNRCLQKLLKYFRSSFGTWFQISSAIWNPRSYLNLRLKFKSSVWRRPFNACGNTGVRLTLSWGAPASYWRARLLWLLWQEEDLQKKLPPLVRLEILPTSLCSRALGMDFRGHAEVWNVAIY